MRRTARTILWIGVPIVLALSLVLILLVPAKDHAAVDARRALAILRLTVLGDEVARVDGVGKRRILQVVVRRRRAGTTIDPNDYFSPYWKGNIPPASAYEFGDASELDELQVQNLTCYETPIQSCCPSCSRSDHPLLADPFYPHWPLVYVAGRVVEVGNRVPQDGLPDDAELRRCFEWPK